MGRLSTEVGGLTWGPLTGKQGWGVERKELGEGRGLDAAGLTPGPGLQGEEGGEGFGGLEWDTAGSGGRQWRGHWEQWCFVLAWRVERCL